MFLVQTYNAKADQLQTRFFVDLYQVENFIRALSSDEVFTIRYTSGVKLLKKETELYPLFLQQREYSLKVFFLLHAEPKELENFQRNLERGNN
jgi:hypothetical protein